MNEFDGIRGNANWINADYYGNVTNNGEFDQTLSENKIKFPGVG